MPSFAVVFLFIFALLPFPPTSAKFNPYAQVGGHILTLSLKNSTLTLLLPSHSLSLSTPSTHATLLPDSKGLLLSTGTPSDCRLLSSHLSSTVYPLCLLKWRNYLYSRRDNPLHVSSILTGVNDGGEVYVTDGIGSVERKVGGCVSGTEVGRNLGWGIIDGILEEDGGGGGGVDVDLGVHSKGLGGGELGRTGGGKKWLENLGRERVIEMMIEGGRGIVNVDSGAGGKGVMFEIGEEGVKRWEVDVS
ncbi:hypothetical protein TrST_g5139 [Triparma strigata]|uniref:Uncharacterized protein n=1 Tax=Triparma strigata TaxID=1606541 RepID=A0A9W7EJI6_9STRA|nr:hypothetical protein TrST_g5139 [Triparma strigata]